MEDFKKLSPSEKVRHTFDGIGINRYAVVDAVRVTPATLVEAFYEIHPNAPKLTEEMVRRLLYFNLYWQGNLMHDFWAAVIRHVASVGEDYDEMTGRKFACPSCGSSDLDMAKSLAGKAFCKKCEHGGWKKDFEVS